MRDQNTPGPCTGFQVSLAVTMATGTRRKPAPGGVSSHPVSVTMECESENPAVVQRPPARSRGGGAACRMAGAWQRDGAAFAEQSSVGLPRC